MLPYAGTIFLSAFLLFLVQPLIAKQILPWFGGSAAVWTTCLVFFQSALLAGYAYADATHHLGIKIQAKLHLALLALSLLTLPILAAETWKPRGDEQPILRILLLLLATIGLPYFLLSSTTPLLQAWYVRRFQADAPYRLFALSNFASLLALLGFPVLFEPWFSLPWLAWGWSALYAGFVVVCGTAGWLTLRAPAPATRVSQAAEAPAPAPTWLAQAQWLMLSAMGSIMLLGVTNHITQNIASVPFLWVLPLSLYLITLILCFDHPRWYVRDFFIPASMLAIPAMAWKISSLDLRVATAIFFGGLFVSCMVCHGELSRAKPHPRYLTRFYLMVSLGGALGAVLIAIVAPLVMSGYFEINVALVLLAIVLLVQAVGVGEPWIQASTRSWVGFTATAAAVAVAVVVFKSADPWHRLAVAAPVGLALTLVQVSGAERFASLLVLGVTGYYSYVSAERYAAGTRAMQRDFYGVVRTADDTDQGQAYRAMYHGHIIHGGQLLGDDKKGQASDYFGPTSGYGRTFAALNDLRPQPRNVGIIGLGAGVAASYGRAGDEMTFYEISPTVIDVQDKEFTFLKDTPAKTKVVLGDGRSSLEREQNVRYDLLGIDAFSGDAIPMHLITREAMELYTKHLADDGVLVFQVTNRYVDLPPVIKRLASEQGMQAVLMVDDPEVTPNSDAWRQHSEQVLVTKNQAFLEHPLIKEISQEIEDRPALPTFTDSHHNMFRILK
jgi:hypothetical protein